jgi:hypothetical protein
MGQPQGHARYVHTSTFAVCCLLFFVLLTPFRIPKDVKQRVIACREVRGLASKRGLCRPRFARWQKLKPKTFQVTTVNR